MNELKVTDFNGQKVIDSRDVAVMVEREHYELLKNIRLYIEYLGAGNFPLSDFFIESSYITTQNRVMPCYLITKKGCDLIANKLTGKKGRVIYGGVCNSF